MDIFEVDVTDEIIFFKTSFTVAIDSGGLRIRDGDKDFDWFR